MLLPYIDDAFVLPLTLRIIVSTRPKRLPRWTAKLPGGQIVASGHFGSNAIYIDYVDSAWTVAFAPYQITVRRK